MSMIPTHGTFPKNLFNPTQEYSGGQSGILMTFCRNVERILKFRGYGVFFIWETDSKKPSQTCSNQILRVHPTDYLVLFRPRIPLAPFLKATDSHFLYFLCRTPSGNRFAPRKSPTSCGLSSRCQACLR